MASLGAANLVPLPSKHGLPSSLQAPNTFRLARRFLAKLPRVANMEAFKMMDQPSLAANSTIQIESQTVSKDAEMPGEALSVSKLWVILESVADRAEMHAIIGEQRDNWNKLLLSSINSITLAASAMCGLSAMTTNTSAHLAFKLSSVLLYSTATGLMLVVNKIQPSQLAEEQRNAARLFRELEKTIEAALALRSPTPADVEDAMKRVLALDKAYPLSLLPGMLDKFPNTVKPAVWWPSKHSLQRYRLMGRNGWSVELSEEMTAILGILKRRDTMEYVRLGKLVLTVNRVLATAGPLLAAAAAFGAAFVGYSCGLWPVLLGVISGAFATVVNTLQHGGQVGMVFEMFRNCAGFYRRLEEDIEANLNEREVKRRENGELFKMKVALQLGRSLSDLKSLAVSSGRCRDGEETQEFGGKLF